MNYFVQPKRNIILFFNKILSKDPFCIKTKDSKTYIVGFTSEKKATEFMNYLLNKYGDFFPEHGFYFYHFSKSDIKRLYKLPFLLNPTKELL